MPPFQYLQIAFNQRQRSRALIPHIDLIYFNRKSNLNTITIDVSKFTWSYFSCNPRCGNCRIVLKKVRAKRLNFQKNISIVAGIKIYKKSLPKTLLNSEHLTGYWWTIMLRTTSRKNMFIDTGTFLLWLQKELMLDNNNCWLFSKNDSLYQ